MKKTPKQRTIHAIGGAIYILWALGGLWLLMLYFERLSETSVAKIIFPINPVHTEMTPSESVSLPLAPSFSPLFIGLALVVALAVILAVIYVMARVYVPDVHRVAQQAVQRTAEVSVDRAVRRHVVPAKERRKLTTRVVFWVKVIICLVPVVVVFVVPGTTTFLSHDVARAGTLFFAVLAFGLTLMQHALMHRWRVRET